MAGQGTLGLELCEQVAEVTQVVVPVGGGGLISGVATAVKALAPQARVIGVEPAVISTLGASIAAGEPLRRPAGTTIADALAPPSLGQAPLTVLSELLDEAVSVSEEQIAEGFRFLYARAKLASSLRRRRPWPRSSRGSSSRFRAPCSCSRAATSRPRSRPRCSPAEPQATRSAWAPAGSAAQSISTIRSSGAPELVRARDQLRHQRRGAAHGLAERHAAQPQPGEQTGEDVAGAAPELRDVRRPRQPRAVGVEADDVLCRPSVVLQHQPLDDHLARARRVQLARGGDRLADARDRPVDEPLELEAVRHEQVGARHRLLAERAHELGRDVELALVAEHRIAYVQASGRASRTIASASSTKCHASGRPR